jgi:Prokaryotic E2 family E/Multiubiquitin
MSIVAEVIDLEEYAKAKKTPPKGKHYRIKVDRDYFTVDVPEMNGRQILELAKKTPPERFKLFQHLHGGKTDRVELDQKVDFTTPGIEKFKTLPIDSTDGLAEPRQQFKLPEADEELLGCLGLRWETLIEAQVKWLIVYGYPIPAGYNVLIADVALRIDAQYPVAQIDMAYFAPGLSRADSRGIAGLSNLVLDDRSFQQWSRHRTAANPWRAGIDDVESHLLLVNHWLQHELTR